MSNPIIKLYFKQTNKLHPFGISPHLFLPSCIFCSNWMCNSLNLFSSVFLRIRFRDCKSIPSPELITPMMYQSCVLSRELTDSFINHNQPRQNSTSRLTGLAFDWSRCMTVGRGAYLSAPPQTAHARETDGLRHTLKSCTITSKQASRSYYQLLTSCSPAPRFWLSHV